MVCILVDWDKHYVSDEQKMSLAINLAMENVRRSTGGPFGGRFSMHSRAKFFPSE
jgi:hypothetical protein